MGLQNSTASASNGCSVMVAQLLVQLNIFQAQALLQQGLKVVASGSANNR
jgi:hypothetical protein